MDESSLDTEALGLTEEEAAPEADDEVVNEEQTPEIAEEDNADIDYAQRVEDDLAEIRKEFPALHGCAVGDGIAVPKIQDLADPGVEGLRPTQAQPETPVQQQRGRERQRPSTPAPFVS